jgi:hypothetical protein
MQPPLSAGRRVAIQQLSIEEIDNVVTGDRHWQQDGFGTTGEAYHRGIAGGLAPEGMAAGIPDDVGLGLDYPPHHPAIRVVAD